MSDQTKEQVRIVVSFKSKTLPDFIVDCPTMGRATSMVEGWFSSGRVLKPFSSEGNATYIPMHQVESIARFVLPAAPPEGV